MKAEFVYLVQWVTAEGRHAEAFRHQGDADVFAAQKMLGGAEAWTTPLAVRESEPAPKRCEACRSTGLLHCSDPANCGGPWDEHVEATGAQS